MKKLRENSLSEDKHPLSSRMSRRRVVHLALIYCAVLVAFIAVVGKDSRLFETLATAAFGLSGSIIGFYIAGGAWENVNAPKEKPVEPSSKSKLKEKMKEE